MRNFLAATLVLFASTQVSLSESIPRERFDMKCQVIRLIDEDTNQDVDKILRCRNNEAICYADNNDLSCIEIGRGGREYR